MSPIRKDAIQAVCSFGWMEFALFGFSDPKGFLFPCLCGIPSPVADVPSVFVVGGSVLGGCSNSDRHNRAGATVQ